jgi:hypothetical protein
LYWFTNDYWTFELADRNTKVGRLPERQPSLLAPSDNMEFALFSGGLDSLAGVGNRLATTHHCFSLLGTGSNKYVQGIQKQGKQYLYNRFGDRVKYISLPIHVNNTKNIRKNTLCRSRGFVFLMIGAAGTYLQGNNHLHIYENGIGAINLPLRRSAIGLDHSRSVHPLSLLWMSDLISAILDESFVFSNPFLLQTKAQMCRIFIDDIDFADTAFNNTVTCDKKPRNKISKQCGLCTSCLLRRQAFASIGIVDETQYVATNSETVPRNHEHLHATLQHVEKLQSLLHSEQPWKHLSNEYNLLPEIVLHAERIHNITPDEMQTGLVELLSTYVNEWKIAEPIILDGIATFQ